LRPPPRASAALRASVALRASGLRVLLLPPPADSDEVGV